MKHEKIAKKMLKTMKNLGHIPCVPQQETDVPGDLQHRRISDPPRNPAAQRRQAHTHAPLSQRVRTLELVPPWSIGRPAPGHESLGYHCAMMRWLVGRDLLHQPQTHRLSYQPQKIRPTRRGLALRLLQDLPRDPLRDLLLSPCAARWILCGWGSYCSTITTRTTATRGNSACKLQTHNQIWFGLFHRRAR